MLILYDFHFILGKYGNFFRLKKKKHVIFYVKKRGSG